MSIVTEQGAGTSLGQLEELTVEDSRGETRSWRPGRLQRRLLPTFGSLSATELPELLIELLYGPGREGQVMVARFGGPRPVIVRRESSGEASVTIGQHRIEARDKTPGEIAFGVTADVFRNEIVIDGRSLFVAGGAEALRDALRRHFGLADLDRAPTARPTEDLDALRKRRRLLERELAALPRAEDFSFEPVDPPAVGDLLDALEAAREVDRRILTRRLELAQAFEKAARRPPTDFAPANAAVLEQLEHLADELDRERQALEDLRGREELRSPYWARATTGILVIVATLAALAGKSLPEPKLVTFGLILAGLAVVLVGTMWVSRLRRMMDTTRQARLIRAGRQRLRDQARALLPRVGAVADPEELGPESIRELIDRVARRDFSRVLKDIVSPFIDSPAELNVVKKLARALETPIIRAAELVDPKTPAVPLVRVTRAAMSLAGDWSRALSECARRIEAGVEKKVRLQIERQMLEDGLEKLKSTERTLELAAGAVPRRTDPAAENAARRLETRLLPLLRRQLGERAPRSFAADLNPVFPVAPDAATNAYILLMTRLMDLKDAAFRREPIGRFLVDATLPLGPELECSFARIVAELPQAGTLSLVFSRPELEESFRRSAAPLVPALIADASADADRPEPVYSGHAPARNARPAPAHLLL